MFRMNDKQQQQKSVDDTTMLSLVSYAIERQYIVNQNTSSCKRNIIIDESNAVTRNLLLQSKLYHRYLNVPTHGSPNQLLVAQMEQDSFP